MEDYSNKEELVRKCPAEYILDEYILDEYIPRLDEGYVLQPLPQLRVDIVYDGHKSKPSPSAAAVAAPPLLQNQSLDDFDGWHKSKPGSPSTAAVAAPQRRPPQQKSVVQLPVATIEDTKSTDRRYEPAKKYGGTMIENPKKKPEQKCSCSCI